MALSAAGFGVVYGLAARDAGLSPAEAVAMSVFVFAGASQFAAVGLIAQAVPWPAIVLLTALLNSRHLLYSAALRPWLGHAPAAERVAMAHVLTDEAFALSLHHFRRLGRADRAGYWTAGALIFVPWNVATIAGAVGGQVIPDPTRLGVDVIFPVAMAGLAVLLVHGRRDVVAVGAAVLAAVGLGLAVDPAVGIVAGGLVGPLVAMVAVGGSKPPERPAVVAADASAEDATLVRPSAGDDPAIGAVP